METKNKSFSKRAKKLAEELNKNKRVWFLSGGKSLLENYRIILVKKDEIDICTTEGSISKQISEDYARRLSRREFCTNKEEVEIIFYNVAKSILG